jgi:hypothetical protein
MKTNRQYFLKRTNYKYQTLGHGAGSTIWWVGKDGRVKTFRSTGKEFHHDLDPSLDMDGTWRGRIEESGRASILPPITIKTAYSADGKRRISIPNLMQRLRRRGAKLFYCAIPEDNRLWMIVQKCEERP